MPDITLSHKQSLIFQSTAEEIFAGGSAYGGKTFANKCLAIAIAEQVPKAQIAIIRNTSKNLKKNYMLGENSLPELLADSIKSGSVKINYSDMVVTWANGSAIHLMHAEHVETAIENLTGLEFVLIVFDEAALIDERIISHAKSRLRLGSLRIESEFWRARLPRLQLTSNPGGISHGYLKRNYIDPAVPGTEFTNEYGKKVLFIPFGAESNPTVTDYGAYLRGLASMGDPVKYKQLAEGDWDAASEAYFGSAFKRHKNVVPDFDVPEEWPIYRCYDPGFSSPFAYVLICKVKGQNSIVAKDGKTYYFPNDSYIVWREWYGCDNGDVNKGIRWNHADIAEGMRERETNWGVRKRVRAGASDWKIWDGELNIYSDYESRGIRFVKADKAKGSRVAGALRMRALMFAAHQEPNEYPGLYFVDKCVHTIATIPTLPSDDNNPDDVATDNVPDHAYDAVRYGVCMVVKTVGFAQVVGL